MYLHLKNQRGVKTILKRLTTLDHDIDIREYSTFISVIMKCNSYISVNYPYKTNDNHYLRICKNAKDKECDYRIPLDMIDTIFRL